MKYLLSSLLLVIVMSFSIHEEPFYSVPEKPWPDIYGSHRAVLNINEPAQAVSLNLLWRRHDKNPDKKQFIIINAQTKENVQNIHRIQVNNERCKLVFGPVTKPGTYYFYYLPYTIKKNYGFYNNKYLPKESAASLSWISSNQLNNSQFRKTLPEAEVKSIQSRTEFDSFYPMEIVPTKGEKIAFLSNIKSDYILFPESRKFPIRMRDELPLKWLKSGVTDEFEAEALKNEYFAFQIGVFAHKKDLKNLKVSFSDFTNGESVIRQEKLTCFNTGGIDPFGKAFVKKLDVDKEKVQALWMGIDIPETIKAGTYHGNVIIKAENAETQSIKVKLEILDKILPDRGDNEPWRHSRLRWLNSTRGIDDKPTTSYKSIKTINKNKFELSGKILETASNELPASINVYGTEILHQPVKFIVETTSGIANISKPDKINIKKDATGIKIISWKSNTNNIEQTGIRTIESDGYINYKITLKAVKDINLKDVRLEIPLKNELAQYMKGMGLAGTEVPKKQKAKWRGPHDSFWIGNTDGGLWCEFRDDGYHGPLLNLYKPDPPKCWDNKGKGGFMIKKNGKTTTAIAYSGSRKLKQGESITFEWAFLITPVKKINYQSQFVDRYYHNGGKPKPKEKDLKTGIKIVNLHHANDYNPHINYPFIAVNEMKGFVDEMHQKGLKVKIYYTVRELTNYTTELWALRSLGNEILGGGKGGGFTWLQEHLIDDYHPQWYQYFSDKSPDASIVNAPGDSRWYNYYIESLAWLIKNIGIDGLYLDDVSYDRRILKRMRKVFDSEKPGCLLDLHSNTGFSKGPATQYSDFFPYIDKVWFGESFRYNKMSSANWLVEVSGIPFGLMGDMLHEGGNRWLGMLYGMTVRLPWVSNKILANPVPVWELWDNFKIWDAEMIGFWEDDVPVKTNKQDVKITVYKKQGKTLISIGNFSKKLQKVKLSINWKVLGLDKNNVVLSAPEIKDYQAAAQFKPDDVIEVKGKQGWLIVIEDKK